MTEEQCSVWRHIREMTVPLLCELCYCGPCKIAVAAFVQPTKLVTRPHYFIRDDGTTWHEKDAEYYRLGGT